MLKMQNAVPKLSETPGAVRWAGRELGEHNVEVYGEVLGYDSADLADLSARGVI